MTLPAGWAVAALAEAASRVEDCAHRTPKYSDEGIPALRPRDVVGGRLDIVGAARVTAAEYEMQTRRYAPVRGDIVYSRELSLGWAVSLPAELVCLSQGMVAIKPGAAVMGAYLVHFLNGPGRALAIQAQAGSAHPHLNLRDIRAMSVPIAPKAEQARIVAAIEEAFSLLDAGEASLHATRTRLRRMRESVLTAAVTGQLVPQDATQKDPPTSSANSVARSPLPLPEGWTKARLGELFTVAVGTTPSRGDPTLWNGDVPWVSSGEVAFNRIKATKESITAKAVVGKPQRVLPPGTVMLAMIGEGKTRGQCAILDIPASHNQNCASIRVPGSDVSSDWVFWVLRERYARTRMDGSGNNQPALNKSLVEAIEIPIPPLAQQDRIVTEVERQFSFIEAAERAVADNLKRSTALRRSVLQAAFEGRLVPQDPSDEPSSVLLERIRAERSTAAKSGAPRGRRKVGG